MSKDLEPDYVPAVSSVMSVKAQTRGEEEFTGPQAEATRARVLDSARSLFARRGYHGTTIRDIARNADVSRGSVYTYFGSKRDLLIILEVASKAKFDELVTTLKDVVDDEAALADWIDRYLDFLDYDQAMTMVWNEAAATDEVLRHEGVKASRFGWSSIGAALGYGADAESVGMMVVLALERSWYYLHVLGAPIEREDWKRSGVTLITALRAQATSASGPTAAHG
ncbi:helix-turn-helix domain-containing protein [Dactylosporangium sp. AC04546]|uniref:TetR/AcrR family transcriptional regulator n=1 Tax=Dactylosporangium sp. AC04546 TaxID=2862460 RepID=UPI001EE15351|nr:TetR/AcrR family transcriptional regulator [Dactylosporangium sp. AC04546]WVK86842.1 helix-turn-helix domain-containing protein [Dactylosporangium sp. AC04546]